jgi:hypothetical protein
MYTLLSACPKALRWSHKSLAAAGDSLAPVLVPAVSMLL